MSGTGFFDQVDFVDPMKPLPVSEKDNERFDPPSLKEDMNPDPIHTIPAVSVERMKEQVDTHQLREQMDAHQQQQQEFWSPGAEIITAARYVAKHIPTRVLALISGPAKSGKTGMVLDSLTPEEVEAGAEVWHIDCDMGGDTTKAAHHEDKKDNLVVISPWVLMTTESRVPYDFPATFQRVMNILNHAHEVAQSQNNYFMEHGTMPNPYLKTLVFDGADHWLNICSTLMKVNDLELGPDGIATTGKKTTTKIGKFNWEIRKNRYKSAITTGLQETARLGVHCYVITHMKPSYDGNGNEILGADVSDILPRTEGDYQQVISVEVFKERNEKGELTGDSHSIATLVESRTSLRCGEKVLIFNRGPDGGKWHGWPGLRDGSFQSSDDTMA